MTSGASSRRASWSRGATIAEVQSALGHTSITMTSRDLGVTDAVFQKSFERFERHLEAPAAILAFKTSGV